MGALAVGGGGEGPGVEVRERFGQESGGATEGEQDGGKGDHGYRFGD